MEQAADDLPLRLARGMLWVTLGLIFSIRVFSGLTDHDGWLSLVFAMVAYPPLVALLMRNWRPRVRYGLVVAQAAVCLLPFLLVGTQWDWMPWPLAAAVLCAFPGRLAWPLLGVVLGGVATGGLLAGFGVYNEVWYLVVTTDDALIIFGLSALLAMVANLHATRGELARLALLRVRLRIDGELREVLGGKLQTIAFRLRRARDEDLEDARHDIREATGIARQTLTEMRAIAAAYRTDAFEDAPVPIESPRLARLVILTVLLIQCVLVLLNLTYGAPEDRVNTLAQILAAVGLAALVVLFLMRPSRLVLIAQALLILLPLLFIPASWERVLSFLTGAILIHGRPPRSWSIAAFALAGNFWLNISIGDVSLVNNIEAVIGQAIIAWWVFGLSRLTGLIAQLDQARHELAQAAVFRERVRVASDLHDVLGFSLSAVALKGELAERHLGKNPDRSKAELTSVIDLVEQALTELPAISGDRVHLGMVTEVETAHDLLETAGIKTTVHVRTGPLPEPLNTAVATVLRESVTNVLRHSAARSCTITITTADLVRLSVTNDGASPSAPRTGGSGLASLAERTGGRLVAGPQPGGGFQVIAEFGSDPARLGGDPDRIDPIPAPQLGQC